MKLTGNITDVNIDFVSGKPRITLEVLEKNELLAEYDSLKECKLDIEIKKARKRRSRDANAYFWKLVDELATVTGESKAEIYKRYIKNIGGVSEFYCGKEEAVRRLCDNWNSNGLGWQTETFPSKIEGCLNVILYYGSSTYDTAQMSRLIDMCVQDCEALNIPTKTPDEIARLVSLWGGE